MAKKNDNTKTQLENISKLFSKSNWTPQQSNSKRKIKQKRSDEVNNLEVQDLIDYIRVSVKYLLFDIDAYKREMEYLRKLLKDNNIS